MPLGAHSRAGGRGTRPPAPAKVAACSGGGVVVEWWWSGGGGSLFRQQAVYYMASLPLSANVLAMTVMATNMPLVGRG